MIRLFFQQLPRVFVLAIYAFVGLIPGLAQTPLGNGVHQSETLELNTTNYFAFSAKIGDAIHLRMGAPFRPLLGLYAPNGTLVTSAAGANNSAIDAALTTTAKFTGVYSVAASSFYRTGKGPYTLTLAQVPGSFDTSPGDEGGVLTNGIAQSGNISLGDMDLWSFSVNSGDSIHLRIGAPEFRPLLRVYGPTGELLEQNAGAGSTSNDASIAFRSTVSGILTVVIDSYYGNGLGEYTIHLAKSPGSAVLSPGDEGGLLKNGLTHSGSISLGDIDLWNFSAIAGENIVLRIGSPGFRPLLNLYSPTGALISTDAGDNSSALDAAIAIRVIESGNFSVIAQSYYGEGTGPYQLNFGKFTDPISVSPGDEGGALMNGSNQRATNSLGDIDLWSFTANTGDHIAIRVGAPDFRPLLSVYGPAGALVGTAGGVSADRDANVFFRATNSGTFTIVEQSFYQNGHGLYSLHFARMPGSFVVPADDNGGSLTHGVSREGQVTLGDQDLWQFATCPDEPITLSCEKISGANFTPRLRLFGRTGVLLATASHPTNAVISFRPTDLGINTLLVDANGLNQTGSYRLLGTGIASGLSLCFPVITNSVLYLSGVEGTPGAAFVVSTHTNLSTPIEFWSPILTNQFDGFGVFRQPSGIRPGESQRYFWLRQF